MLKFKEVSKTYKNGVNALYNINLLIEQGEFVYIIGPTGSGKSTLIKLLDAEEKATKGSVEVAGVDLAKLKPRKIPLYRRSIGVVFQDFRLLEHKTIFENVLFALEITNTPVLKARQRVREVLSLVDLADKANDFPSSLSGGQQQRTAIARAIANRPKVLVCDEPTGNLDPAKSADIIRLLEKINREEGTTILMVTHDISMVNSFRKRTIALQDGHIMADLHDGGYIE
ncbi:MAG: cell division ATP-binding protein FtsE [Firmicutes bacterium GWF2_51_9]|nr:MAG: cell division ATP-binding protein FtsE [Firmicutes bacterium GWF2_51_9]OGS58326.1 MAG: cell division ATP-binding protein FtsE [Firmicutes bacterium GWE2_51_13]HAM63752.1 cell division ATP-binding protein FtsE [Erysipelotrichaceae bacterium]